jgi:hypothetical protein
VSFLPDLSDAEDKFIIKAGSLLEPTFISEAQGIGQKRLRTSTSQELADSEPSKESSNDARTGASQSKPIASGKQQNCPETHVSAGGAVVLAPN